MSFEAIKASVIVRNEKEVTYKLPSSDTEYKITVKELTYPNRLRLAQVQKDGGDINSAMIALSCIDELGNKLSFDEAENLPEDLYNLLLLSCLEVNDFGAEEKN